MFILMENSYLVFNLNLFLPFSSVSLFMLKTKVNGKIILQFSFSFLFLFRSEKQFSHQLVNVPQFIFLFCLFFHIVQSSESGVVFESKHLEANAKSNHQNHHEAELLHDYYWKPFFLIFHPFTIRLVSCRNDLNAPRETLKLSSILECKFRRLSNKKLSSKNFLLRILFNYFFCSCSIEKFVAAQTTVHPGQVSKSF